MPIKHVAVDELKLETHVIDSFTGWTPPIAINLIVAVSFGLFVPPRILNLAKYGGLNVHPSLLPDLRGPAPIEHALLRNRTHTGVSVQTLDPHHFDQGIILAQTPAPGLPISHDTDVTTLEAQLAAKGAELLIHVLRASAFVPPLKDAGWYINSHGPMNHAPKVNKQDRFIDFQKQTMSDIFAVQRALGDPWCLLPNGDRLILHKVISTDNISMDDRAPGIWIEKTHKFPLFRAACGTVGEIHESTYAGSKAGHGNAKLCRMISAEKK